MQLFCKFQRGAAQSLIIDSKILSNLTDSSDFAIYFGC